MESLSQVFEGLIGAIAYRDPDLSDPLHLPLVLAGLAATGILIWRLRGRAWAFAYVALIPFLNWTFSIGDRVEIDLASLAPGLFGGGDTPVIFQPITILTGLVFVVRDFVQREMGHRVLILMGLAILWSFYYSWPVIAVASAAAFAISETVDWLLFTFTRYRLSTRILLSSALAAPVDTSVFLFGADLALQMTGEPAGQMLNLPNWVFFILGKMIGALVVSAMIRQREIRGQVDPAAP